jgi:hypothetical protein
MASSGMLSRVALVRTDVLVLTRSTRRNILEDAILHNHRRENLKSYMNYSMFLDRTYLPIM